jgi:hypothetical protein
MPERIQKQVKKRKLPEPAPSDVYPVTWEDWPRSVIHHVVTCHCPLCLDVTL